MALLAASLAGLMYLGFGIVLLLWPKSVLEKAYIHLSHPVGIMEARSFYGGLEIGLGVYILYNAFRGSMIHALSLSVLVIGGVLVGRIYGAFVDNAWSMYLLYAVLIEGSIFLLNIYSLWQYYLVPASPQ